MKSLPNKAVLQLFNRCKDARSWKLLFQPRAVLPLFTCSHVAASVYVIFHDKHAGPGGAHVHCFIHELLIKAIIHFKGLDFLHFPVFTLLVVLAGMHPWARNVVLPICWPAMT